MKRAVFVLAMTLCSTCFASKITALDIFESAETSKYRIENTVFHPGTNYTQKYDLEFFDKKTGGIANRVTFGYDTGFFCPSKGQSGTATYFAKTGLTEAGAVGATAPVARPLELPDSRLVFVTRNLGNTNSCFIWSGNFFLVITDSKGNVQQTRFYKVGQTESGMPSIGIASQDFVCERLGSRFVEVKKGDVLVYMAPAWHNDEASITSINPRDWSVRSSGVYYENNVTSYDPPECLQNFPFEKLQDAGLYKEIPY